VILPCTPVDCSAKLSYLEETMDIIRGYNLSGIIENKVGNNFHKTEKTLKFALTKTAKSRFRH
jgi:hypothetical protein